MSKPPFRPLTKKDIDTLGKNGCWCEDWQSVRAGKGFDPKRVKNTVLYGQIRIGSTKGNCRDANGIEKASGIFRAWLKNVTIGDNCRVADVNGCLSQLDIQAGAIIENVGTIACTGRSTFGNGHEIAVLNEGGGRELKITENTNSQIAYLSVLYRDRAELTKRLDAIADKVAKERESDRASIGAGAKVSNCGSIVNVNIGPSAVVNGAQSLKNGTVDSSKKAPTTVGNGVIAEDFIFQKGSSVKDGAMMSGTLVGEGTKIGKQFSAENSVFFANSEGFHSEACSLFAGPYSVTHHRSTLLIAALCSFYNAGSGTNQSNHMYKLGPLHQGILERGCKTGSFSYLLWPSRVGAFSAIIGKHYANFDTSDFPFSYVNEEHGKSTLVPGMNFFTVGTLRDAEKWPARDRRKTDPKLDFVIFDVLSPYTGQKMMRGMKILADLLEKADRSQTYVTYQGIHIKRLLLKTCRRYYRLALDKYLGDIVMARLEKTKSFRKALKEEADARPGNSEWIDVCGLLCVQDRIQELVGRVESGKIADTGQLRAGLQTIFDSYKRDEWNWVMFAFEQVYAKSLGDATADDIRSLLKAWKSASLKLLNMVEGDASKEFEGSTKTGFGIDGNPDADFEAVRGTLDSNKFVEKLREDAKAIEKRFGTVNAMIS